MKTLSDEVKFVAAAREILLSQSDLAAVSRDVNVGMVIDRALDALVRKRRKARAGKVPGRAVLSSDELNEGFIPSKYVVLAGSVGGEMKQAFDTLDKIDLLHEAEGTITVVYSSTIGPCLFEARSINERTRLLRALA